MDGEQGAEVLSESTNEFVLANGNVLHLRPLKNLAPVRHIYIELAKLGGLEGLKNIKKIPKANQTRLISLYQQLSRYTIGWGVIDDPPTDAGEVLSVLELEPRPNRPNIGRADWLMFCEIGGDDERQALISEIMAITTGTQTTDDSEDDSESE